MVMSKLLIVGHSHIVALMQADAAKADAALERPGFLLLRDRDLQSPLTVGRDEESRRRLTNDVSGIDQVRVQARIEKANAQVVALCLNGNEHSGPGMFISPEMTHDNKIVRVVTTVQERIGSWLDYLQPRMVGRVLLFPSPPPISSNTLIESFPPERVAKFSGLMLEPPIFRLRLWRAQFDAVINLCAERGVEYVPLPAEIFDEQGLLDRQFWGADPMHGNAAYGRVMLDHLRRVISAPPAEVTQSVKPTVPPRHPYTDLPDTSFWKQSISMCALGEVDPVLEPPFRIGRKDRVATAGSCFAQHISKRLRGAGFSYMVAEPGPTDADVGAQRGFYDFSARYGNIYTARQLLQLFERAFGYFRPLERVWARHEGGFCDPFRPRIEPEGFETEAAVETDARQHLAAVRRMFRQLDVFVFTLGLTECWISRLDGAAYPVAPGVVGGKFDPEQHVFANFTVSDVVADLTRFLEKLRLVNPRARMLLTVSPVPLVATAANQHVLVSTVYSKSVLRVAAEELSQRYEGVCYFPSYEIITGPQAAGAYFEADRRSVKASGVDHVMRVFMSHMTDSGPQAGGSERTRTALSLDSLEALADAACDEEVLGR
jgi:hypothetical protein